MKNLQKTVFTDSERKEYQKIELEMLEEGNTGIEIADKIGVSEDTISTWKAELIARGETTQKKIDEARQKRKEREKEEAKKTDPARSFVLARRLEGKSLREIVAERTLWKNCGLA